MKADPCGPRDTEAERRLLDAALLPESGVAVAAIAAGLRPEDFSEQNFGIIWSAVCACVRAGNAVSETAVWLNLSESDRTHGVLAELRAVDYTRTTSLGADVIAERLMKLGRLRRKKHLARAIAEAAAEGDAERVASLEQDLGQVGSATAADLPQILTWQAALESPETPPPELIDGVLHQGAKLMLGGGSKSFKTWCLLDMALSVSTGTPWWGLRTVKTRVLYVNFELAKWSFDQRRKAICEAKAITEAPFFDAWHLRGHCAALEVLVPRFVHAARSRNYGLIVLDPIYKALGARDENANGDVASLLNQVEALAVRLGAAIVFGHHFSKGNQAAKEAKDRVSGAGAWARDPDSLVTLTSHEEEDCFVVDYVLRNHGPKKSQVVRWRFPCMEVTPDLDPAALRQPGRPRAAGQKDLIGLLSDEGMTNAQWFKAASAANISDGTYRRRRDELAKAGVVENVMGVWRRKS